ncbi:DegT/DnrJ/EryC1/StrS family aminotransferase [Chryseobacterium defluvii]|uniref:dTDP-4-amino-4,6-dideoxygalactose transaminase n=1 Tax=Chryseobacterium defluvii TaxID=160396 RepID=A0A495SMM2_9FLAO|nr:DegT/DnrJ/EryC1/StrS family aminotransferase [Chryseobacterium defluvii]RKT01336.1 dTDP-4-amino-4,6-dideoxygalactose transaminase [Chryseobacterium defluvii]
MIPIVKPYLPPREDLIPEIEKILYSGYIAEGEPVYEFERKFADFLDNKNVLALHSGTDALHIALLLAGVGFGDEVISTPMTAEPTNVAITMVGGKVVWGDVDPNSGLLSPESVRSLITEKTKAILLVHYAGMVCDMDEFNKISQEFNIPIIEDAAHALGSKYNGQYVGSNSPYTIFSLQAIKHMTTVDGGFLTFKESVQLPRAKKMRWFGLDKGKSRLENDITETGYKYAMNNVNATIGLVQMKYLEEVLGKYIGNGKFYDEALKGIDGIELVNYNKNTEPSYWLYTMKVDRRDDFIALMTENGISASPLHHRNDLHSIFAESKRELPGMDRFYEKLVHIPCGWWVSDEDRTRIADTIKKGW